MTDQTTTPEGAHERGPAPSDHPLPVRAADIMTADPVTVQPTTPIRHVAQVLLSWDVDSVPVVDEAGHLAGIVSVADLITREGFPAARSNPLTHLIDALNEHRHHWTQRTRGSTVQDVMTTELITCEPDEPVAVIVRRMLARDVRALPVVEDGELKGIVARRDCLALFDRTDEEIQRDVDTLLASALWTPEGHEVEAVTAGGGVHLTGQTRYPEDARLISDVVRQVPGVVEVTDEVIALEDDDEEEIFFP